MQNSMCPNCGGAIKYDYSNKGICQSCGGEFLPEQATNIYAQLERAYDLVSQKKYVGAERIFNQCLLSNPKCGQAYLGLLLCYLNLQQVDMLASVGKDYENNSNYTRAIQYLEGDEREKLQSLCEQNKQFRSQAGPIGGNPYKTIIEKFEQYYYTNVDGNRVDLGLFWDVCKRRYSEEAAYKVVMEYFEDNMDPMAEIVKELPEGWQNKFDISFVAKVKTFMSIYEKIPSLKVAVAAIENEYEQKSKKLKSLVKVDVDLSKKPWYSIPSSVQSIVFSKKMGKSKFEDNLMRIIGELLFYEEEDFYDYAEKVYEYYFQEFKQICGYWDKNNFSDSSIFNKISNEIPESWNDVYSVIGGWVDGDTEDDSDDYEFEANEISKLKREISSIDEQVNVLCRELSKVGFFGFAKKKELKSQIDNLLRKKKELEKNIKKLRD